MNYVISIIAPERLEILTDLCEGLGLPLTVTLHGRGTAVQSMLDLLGIESNERRVVLTIADAEKTAALIAAQKRRLHIGVPGARHRHRRADQKCRRRKYGGISERREKPEIHAGPELRL